MDHIVFRKGQRLYLRPILSEDLPKITVWINDPEISRYLKVQSPISPEDERKWFDSLANRAGKDVVFAIVLADSHELIGVMGLHRINFQHGTADTGSFIGRKDLWSQGYGTEAKMLVLEYAFKDLGLRKICSLVYDFNKRSARCLEKCGYVREGVRKAHRWRNGRFVDEYEFAVFKDAFLALQKKPKQKRNSQGNKNPKRNHNKSK